MPVPKLPARSTPSRCVMNVLAIYYTIRSNIHSQVCGRKIRHERTVDRQKINPIGLHVWMIKYLYAYRITWLMVLGPNHSPMFFPSCLPSNAILWIENGARGESSSRNHWMICRYSLEAAPFRLQSEIQIKWLEL